ncbi:pentapeptide repeat-containing protein [Roseivirga echinicomitans]
MKQQITLKLTLFTFLLITLCSVNAQAQSTVKASEIMKAMKNGEDIKYSNVTVSGTLDFTYMDEKAPDLPRRRSWWRNGGSNTVNELIKSKISFENVVFENDVIAYFHDDRSEYTFTADFEEAVIFKNCKFEGDAMFKYSEFEQEASFAGSIFKDESTFKYAEFARLADFSNTQFDENAIFKYTEFKDGVNLSSARFERSLDIKYTKVRGDFDTSNLYVRWEIDSKYTDINGRKFSVNMQDN